MPECLGVKRPRAYPQRVVPPVTVSCGPLQGSGAGRVSIPDAPIHRIGGRPTGDGLPSLRSGDPIGGSFQPGVVGQAEGLRPVQAGNVGQLSHSELVAVRTAARHDVSPVGCGPTPRRPVMSRASPIGGRCR